MHYFLFVGTVVMAAVPCRKYGLVEWSKVGRKEGLPSVTEGGGGELGGAGYLKRSNGKEIKLAAPIYFIASWRFPGEDSNTLFILIMVIYLFITIIFFRTANNLIRIIPPSIEFDDSIASVFSLVSPVGKLLQD